MYNVYSYEYEYDEKGNFLRCIESSVKFEGNFDLSLENEEKSIKAMKKLGTESFSDKFKGKTHRRYYAVDEQLEIPDDNYYDEWSFVISNSHITLGYKL